jgi:hypothetical protein
MTPKEKAQELIKKFNPLVTRWDCHGDTPKNEEDIIADAKQCALITVDKILESYKTKDLIYPKEVIYWQEVKQEINNL